MKTYYEPKIDDVVVCAEELICVQSVATLENYKLDLLFSNGKRGIFDSAPLFDKKIYAPLKNKQLFDTAKVSCGTVVWQNDIDIAPEYLWENSER